MNTSKTDTRITTPGIDSPIGPMRPIGPMSPTDHRTPATAHRQEPNHDH